MQLVWYSVVSMIILCVALCGIMVDYMSMYHGILYGILEVLYRHDNSNIMWYIVSV